SLVAAGFDAVYVNRLGYADGGAAVEAEIVATIGAQTPMLNGNATLATYDLRGYASELRTSGADLPSRESVLYPLRIGAGAGVYGEEHSESERWYWAQSEASFLLANPSADDAKAAITGTIKVASPAATVQVSVGGEVTTLRVVDGSAVLDLVVSAPAGATDVTFTTDSAPTPTGTGDPRDLRLRIMDLRVSRLD
ncbi:MAG: hypothetical protein HGA44_15385, partial [Cellulomonadaceae bacterium]|nr:hypothetical protein [Cellulomonadaceae bacterium]